VVAYSGFEHWFFWKDFCLKPKVAIIHSLGDVVEKVAIILWEI
jgi:hypothetical protein